ncbi:elongation factor G [Sneathiella sp. P13V-1]|uniref:elongation factor G n=1 Tax=Sneathiella sp. P13V-1 TaxID=2697366 RepID=UPI00187B6088|nr:elongation factor G [Sneathiella sp. P13V-1]MBE7638046.1 elongation factor G [Sneathiella sp. P13V-1]
MSTHQLKGPRNIALIGPYSSGKTTLLESILHICGEIDRKGTVEAGTSVGDHSAEARSRKMSVEVNSAHFSFMDEEFSVLDCPGSIEFLQETRSMISGVDAAILVCEPDPTRNITLLPFIKTLEDHHIPTFFFVNKIDRARGSVYDLFQALEEVSHRDLVLRQMPIVTDGTVTGYVDLASERTYVYKEGRPSQIIDMPADMAEQEGTSRFTMLETLADYDDHLMEELLEDISPEKEEIYDLLQKDLKDGSVLPVFVGSALNGFGVRRLLKALRHEVPDNDETIKARKIAAAANANIAQVLKTYISPQAGKLSLCRVWSGEFHDGDHLQKGRIGGIFRLQGGKSEKLKSAKAGEIVAFGRLDDLHTGEYLTDNGVTLNGVDKPLTPVFDMSLHVDKQEEEVKLTAALNKLTEEDPSLVAEHRQTTQELVLKGQGAIHLRVALDKLDSKYGLKVHSEIPKVAYHEAIRKGTTQHSRYKKQSGGHGQFGDVKIEIAPLPRGSGFAFQDTIVGGSVPRQFIPAVEHGVKDYLVKGPLGFPVVDISVTLVDGQHHSVDSSENAFRSAARLAMSEGMVNCSPVLLEPIVKVEVVMPSEFTSRVNSLVSARRGQILGFEGREGWPGWDTLNVLLPESEIRDMITELRSATQGVGTFSYEFDHLQELTGQEADKIVQQQKGE